MEVSFLKDAINRIAEMAQPFVMEVDGRKYCSFDMYEIEGQGEKPLPYQVDTLDALIQLIRTEGVKTYERLYVRVKDPRAVVVDSGVTQEVSVRRGVALKEQQTVQPIVHLQPYRTFLEVAQPASDFLLRIDKDGHPALYEADGGAWKLEAKRSIAAYLGEQLADLVESGNVVVMI